MPTTFNKKKYTTALFFEIGLGIISASLAIYGLVFVANNITDTHGMWTEIDPRMWNASFTFWIGYLIFSIFLIFLGIYEIYREKNFEKYKNKKRKELKAPIR